MTGGDILGPTWDRSEALSAESFDTGFRASSRSWLETELGVGVPG